MQIKTKLNFSFALLVILLGLTGYIGIKATQNIYENHLVTEKVADLLFTQNKMIAITDEAITASDLSRLQDLKYKFDELAQSFRVTHADIKDISNDIFHNELVSHEKALETIGSDIFKIHGKKLNQQETFSANYPIEKTQRENIREVLFTLEVPHLLKEMGDIQYFSKETLYQYRDQEHLSEWLEAIEGIKILTSQINSTVLPQATKDRVLKELNQYMNTAKIMGDIAITEKAIEGWEAKQIAELQKIIQKSEKTGSLLKNKITQASESLLHNILLTQMAFIGVIVICAFLFSAYISRSISAAVRNLKNGVAKVTNGQLETKIQVDTKDEFSNLANAFNHMTEELKQAKGSLEEYSRNLEQKVAERTEELEQAVREVQQTNEQLRSLSSKLSKYLSPQVYQSIFSGRKDVKLETYRKKLTVFFSDIQGFTNLTDSMESEALTSLLNTYLNEMADIALRHGGTIDKFIGDAVMVFFGDPETDGKENDALACILMALEMREKMKCLRRQWEAQGIAQPLNIRMGINTGYCTVGNFGSESRLDYTIIGGQVNLASRLESHAEANQILISYETYALVKDKIQCEKKEKITVKGIAHPVQTFQVIDRKDKLIEGTKEIREEFEGFMLSADVNPSNKEQVVCTLKKAIEELDRPERKNNPVIKLEVA